jgi:hypothetical protein
MCRGPKSQIAVIITFVIGLSLLFGVFFINLYKVSNFKLLTANIVDKGALGMCSALGSHANLLIQTASHRGFLGLSNCNPNWDLILPLAGLIVSIVLGIWGMTVGLPILIFPALLLGGYSLSATIAEVNAIMKGAASAVVKEMVDYNGIREMSIQSMLSQIQTDPVNVERPNASSTVFTDPNGNSYDLTGSTVLPTIRDRLHIPRFIAWYYSDRFPQVSDRPLLTQIDAFITFLTQITRIETWDRNWMMIREISLKADGLFSVITGNYPPWVIDMDSVRALGPVPPDGGLTLASLINMILHNQNPGFLPTTFVLLTQRLLDAGYENPISYSTRNPLAIIPIIGQLFGYDHTQIWNVVEDLRGFLIRTMEVLNMPVSERLPTISKWLPAFFNPSANHGNLDDGEDFWEIIQRDIIKINDWIQQLNAVDAQIRAEIPPLNGYTSYGYFPPAGNSCYTEICDECSDDCTTCSCSPMICTLEGRWCNGCGGNSPPVCSHGDLFMVNPPGYCPLPGPYDPGCCEACPQSPACSRACDFMGQYTHLATIGGGRTEVGQAIAVLTRLVTILQTIPPACCALNTALNQAVNPTNPNLIALKNEAVYGWSSKNWDDLSNPNFQDTYHLARVRVERYLPFSQFPYLEEKRDWIAGLLKCWYVRGQTSGNMDFSVSRYDSDLPSVWWNFRFRKQAGAAQFPIATLNQIINAIHQNNSQVTSDYDANVSNLLSSYAINSKTRGYYGPNKSQIQIERMQ